MTHCFRNRKQSLEMGHVPISPTVALGNWAANQYNNNLVARYAMDHPFQAGVAVGVLVGATVAGGVVAGGGAIACGVLCGSGAATVATTGGIVAATQADKLRQYTQFFGPSNAQKMIEVSRLFENAGVKVSDHGLFRSIQRLADGATPEKVISAFNSGSKYYDTAYKNINYFKDGVRIVVDEAGKIITVVGQKAMNADRFIPLK